ncbi:MAG: hypothetical protein G01um101438_161 [Parcubacteria group bacterium Gr01-1014_38]|nr:MAG: hypothetical protein G01um101438_161 [Parcubacteria group bacterium Gr01-1014_38]
MPSKALVRFFGRRPEMKIRDDGKERAQPFRTSHKKTSSFHGFSREPVCEKLDGGMWTTRQGLIRLIVLLGAFPFVGAGCVRESGPQASPLPPGGIYRSDDGGITFFQKVLLADGGNLSAVRPRHVESARVAPDTLYLAADEGLFRTTSAGDRWERLAIPAGEVHGVSVHPRNPRILLAAGAAPAPNQRGKIWKSLDAGETWAEVFTAPTATVEVGALVRRRREVRAMVTVVAHDARSPEVVYAGTSTGALLVSTDGGIHWQTRRSFQQGITGLKVSPAAGALLLIRLTDGSLVRSSDGGTSGDLVRLGRTRDQRERDDPGLLPVGFGEPRDPAHAVLFLKPVEGRTPMLVGTQSALYRSDDDGDTWTKLKLPSSGTVRTPVVSIAQSPNGTLWAASGSVLFSSTDDGNTWRALDTPLRASLRFVVADPVHANRLYLVFRR